MPEDRAVPQTPPPAPHRLLFLHGLFRKSYPNSGRTVAELLAKGLDRARVTAAPDLLLDDGGRCACYLVQPELDPAAWRAVEVVEVEYDDIIKERDAHRSLIQRTLIGLWAVLADSPRYLRLLWPGHPRITLGQVGMAVTILIVFLIALAVTLAALIPIALGAFDYLTAVLAKAGFLSDGPATSLSVEAEAAASARLAASLAFLAFIAAVVKIFGWKALSETLDDAASATLAIRDYQRPGSELYRALHTRAKSALRAGAGPGGDRTFSILAFSQGSLLTIDALFPVQAETGLEPAPRPRIDLLVTLGCPLAVVTRLWPTRPSRPAACQAEVRRWINFYETHDPLGGRIAALIKDEGVVTEPEDREFSFTQASGRRSASPHFTYWLEGSKDHRPSATQIATELVRVG